MRFPSGEQPRVAPISQPLTFLGGVQAACVQFCEGREPFYKDEFIKSVTINYLAAYQFSSNKPGEKKTPFVSVPNKKRSI